MQLQINSPDSAMTNKMLDSIERAIHYAQKLDEASPQCARAIIERRKQAGDLMLATEGSWRDRHALHRWADDGGACHD